MNDIQQCIICDTVLPEAERQIEILTELSAKLAVDLVLARLELDKLLQEREVWFTNSVNGPN
jgi:hypothetical protein